MSTNDHSSSHELLRQATLLDFEIVSVTEGDLAPEGSMHIELRTSEEDVECFAFGLLYALGLLSFHEARPAGASELHFEEEDEWTIGDMVEHLRFQMGRLRLETDYVRGRLMKTTVDITPDGKITLQTRNRGGSARRWLDLLRGKGRSGLIALVQEEPARFFSEGGDALRSLEDWRSVHPALHWKPSRSAVRLAETWGGAGGFPRAIEAALERAARLQNLSFLKGVVEHETPMPGKGRSSVTDLMVWAEDELGNPVIIGVEGKVDEGFGPVVRDWLQAGRSPGSAQNRALRMRQICAVLELDERDTVVQSLAYQLLHRTCAAVLTARAERAMRAVMLVHSFLESSEAPGSGWGEFRAFAATLGPGREAPSAGVPWEVGVCDGVELWLCWVC